MEKPEPPIKRKPGPPRTEDFIEGGEVVSDVEQPNEEDSAFIDDGDIEYEVSEEEVVPIKPKRKKSAKKPKRKRRLRKTSDKKKKV